MSNFATSYRRYAKTALKADRYFGFDVRSVAKVEPVLAFLYNKWWQVELKGLRRLPKHGPALLVGNSAGLIPWPAMMLIYALMQNQNPTQRRLSIVADLDWLSDERLHNLLVQVGFVPWSSANLKRLFAKGEMVAIFPANRSPKDTACLSLIGRAYFPRWKRAFQYIPSPLSVVRNRFPPSRTWKRSPSFCICPRSP
jgi:hypothetical protein